jgi:hypothetical protein
MPEDASQEIPAELAQATKGKSSADEQSADAGTKSAPRPTPSKTKEDAA